MIVRVKRNAYTRLGEKIDKLARATIVYHRIRSSNLDFNSAPQSHWAGGSLNLPTPLSLTCPGLRNYHKKFISKHIFAKILDFTVRVSVPRCTTRRRAFNRAWWMNTQSLETKDLHDFLSRRNGSIYAFVVSYKQSFIRTV